MRAALAVLVVIGLGGAAAAATAVARYASSATQILKVRVGENGGQNGEETRLVVETDQPATARLMADAATASQHIVIALPNARIATTGATAGAAAAASGTGLGRLKAWSVTQGAGVAHLNLDFQQASVVRRRFLLPPDDGIKVYRYVIDFARDASQSPARPSSAPSSPAQPDMASRGRPPLPPRAATLPNTSEAVLTAPPPVTRSRPVIVIDPGHGGKDPGALGPEAAEKDIALASARDLRAALVRTGRYQVVLTRDGDVFVPLEERMQIARREHADLFISLHVNSISDPNLHGATVFTLSEKGADRAARQVFARNGDWFVASAAPTRDPSVNRILLDLTQRETTNQSSGFANLLLDRLSNKVDLLRRSHRDANFVVLLAPDVPAVLLEMGFITNPVDEQRLQSPDDRKVLAATITDAIDSYFSRNSRLAIR
jgi:N-acetylmuramoyl-L-alanine amidase